MSLSATPLEVRDNMLCIAGFLNQTMNNKFLQVCSIFCISFVCSLLCTLSYCVYLCVFVYLRQYIDLLYLICLEKVELNSRTYASYDCFFMQKDPPYIIVTLVHCALMCLATISFYWTITSQTLCITFIICTSVLIVPVLTTVDMRIQCW